MVTKAIASAQAQREAQNFEIRKDVLKYDDVLNRQRTVVYAERRRVLEGEDIGEQVREFLTQTVAGYVAVETGEGYPEDWNLERLWTALKELYPIGITIDEAIEESGGSLHDLNREFLAGLIEEYALRSYDAREAELGEKNMRELERKVTLSVLDRKWREHLLEMDYLRNGIGLRAMAQRDPLVEYQREGYQLFSGMMDSIKEEVAGLVFSVQVRATPPAILSDASATAAGAGVAAAVAAAAAGAAQQEPPSADRATEPEAESVPEPQPRAEADVEPEVEFDLAGLGPQRPSRLQYTAPTEDGGVLAVAEDVEGEDEVVDPNASRAERRRVERVNKKRKRR
jgi:preprotein translocase subunit SecA